MGKVWNRVKNPISIIGRLLTIKKRHLKKIEIWSSNIQISKRGCFIEGPYHNGDTAVQHRDEHGVVTEKNVLIVKVLFMSSVDSDFSMSFNPGEHLTLQEDWTSADFQQLFDRLPRRPPRRWRPQWRRWRSSSCSTRSSSTISTRSSKPSPTQQATGPHGDSLLWVRLLQNWDKWLQLWTPRQYFGCYLEICAFFMASELSRK